MMSKPIFKFRTVLSLATLSAGVLSFAPAAHAGLLGGATGGVGGTLSPRSLDLNGQGHANVARDGKVQLPRGEKLRDAAGSATGEAKGSVATTKATAIDQAQQAQGRVSGTASGSADTAATASKTAASKAAGTATASGSAGVKREGRTVNASAAGEASVSR